ncbi:MAG: TIR domain-containing protein, partial [Myxococcales bacterium]|nr:TIR domain-containing protein [Myxococcales bacterium]
MRELHRLVVSLFVSPADLEQHVRLGRGGAALYAELPTASLSEVAFRWLMLLQARGQLDQNFVNDLVRVRPHRQEDIEEAWRRHRGSESTVPEAPSRGSSTVPLRQGAGGPPRVFISYAHESEARRKQVLDLAQRLRGDGVDAWIDRFEPHQSDWALWMRRELERADVVLCACSAVWRHRYDAESDDGSDTGVRYEGRILRTFVTAARGDAHKIVAVGFSTTDLEHGTPRDLANARTYLLPDRYPDLLGVLLDRPAVAPAPLGGGAGTAVTPEQVRSEGTRAQVGPEGVGRAADEAIERLRQLLQRSDPIRAKLAERFDTEPCVATALTRRGIATLRAFRAVVRDAESRPEVYGSRQEVAHQLRELARCALPWTEEWRDAVLGSEGTRLVARDVSDVVIDFVVSRMVAAPARPVRHVDSGELRGEGHIELDVVASLSDGSFTQPDPTVVDVAVLIADYLDHPVPRDATGRPQPDRLLQEVDELLVSLVDPEEDFEEREHVFLVSRDSEGRAELLAALASALPSLWQVRLAKH